MSTGAGWSDDPITESGADTLQRKNLARETAHLINHVTASRASKVFALTGVWGSGKTSLASLIEDDLKKHFHGWKTAHFTPWAATDTQAMMTEFVTSLVDILPAGKRKEMMEIIGQGITFAAPLSAVLAPLAGIPPTAWTTGAKKISDVLTKQEPWEKTFRRLSEALEDSNEKALVLVDDIDRLDREQLALLLKIIRLLGRFPGIHYLLMYDAETLFETLSGTRGGGAALQYANSYMEKIVQYQIPVPPMSRYQIEQRVQQGLDNIAVRRGRNWDWNDSTYRDARNILVFAFSTPRGIDRYLVQLERVLSLHSPEEIDDIALMLLTVLQTQDPAVYERLPEVKNALTFDKSKHVSWPTKEKKETDWQEVVGADSPWEGSLTKAIINALFPVTRPMDHGDPSSSRNSICHDEYFDRYFVHVIHGQDVPDSLLNGAMNRLLEESDCSALVKVFQQEISEEQVWVALGRLISVTVPKTYDQDSSLSLILVEGVARLQDVLPGNIDSSMSPYGRAQDWLVQILEHIDTTISPADLASALDHIRDPMARAEVLTYALRNSRRVPSQIDPYQGARITLFEETGALYTEELTNFLFALIADQNELADRDWRIARMAFTLSYIGDSEAFQSSMAEGKLDAPTQAEIVACFISVDWSMGSDNRKSIQGINEEGLNRLCPDLQVDFNIADQSSLDPYDTSWTNFVEFARACITYQEVSPQKEPDRPTSVEP